MNEYRIDISFKCPTDSYAMLIADLIRDVVEVDDPEAHVEIGKVDSVVEEGNQTHIYTILLEEPDGN